MFASKGEDKPWKPHTHLLPAPAVDTRRFTPNGWGKRSWPSSLDIRDHGLGLTDGTQGSGYRVRVFGCAVGEVQNQNS